VGSSDAAALHAAGTGGMALCTLVGIEGSFSRRIGAQIAVAPDGRTIGSLSDGCLERQLAADAAATDVPILRRYGRGSPLVDFRLPCGGGLDILIDPRPDRAALAAAAGELVARHGTVMPLPLPPGSTGSLLASRRYIPSLRVLVFGEGPEFSAFAHLATAMGAEVEAHARADSTGHGLALGRVPPGLVVDAWTAILLLFHDHEWERALLGWAVTTPAFFIGAQGGGPARGARTAMLRTEGASEAQIGRIRSPVGLIARTRDPETLALSVLAEIVADYEGLHPHR